jgi:iron(III) transport system substrate-binding protein
MTLTSCLRGRTRRFPAGVLALVLVVAGGAACSGDDDALTIYSGREEEYVGPLYERFTEDTGIELDVRYGDSADLALLIDEEGEASPADVFFSQSPGAIEYLAANDVLAELSEETTGKVVDGFASEEGEWVGTTARQRVLVYNSDEVDESDLPDSVFDLTRPEFKGRVGIAPTNGSFQDFVTAMRQLEGESAAQSWLEDMAANESPTFADNSSIVDAVARGEIDMGLVNHYYNLQYLEEDPEAPSRNYVFPADDVGSLLIASATGVLSSSDMPEEAEELINYVLGDETQEYFVHQTFEYPLTPSIDSPRGLPPIEDVVSVDYDIQNLGGGLKRTVELISESGLG